MRWVKHNGRQQLPPIEVDQNQVLGSGGVDRAGGANIGAGTAILALGGIDYIVAIDFADRAIGALGFAGAALNAVIFANYVCHGSFLSQRIDKTTF